MRKILCVCLGNICRSPLAEGILKKVAFEQGIPLHIQSAGTANYHEGDSADDRSIAVGKKYNVDISSHIGQQFKVKHFDEFDLILVMDYNNLNNVRILARNEADKAKVKMYRRDEEIVDDPYYGGLEGFEEMYHVLSKDALYWVTNE